MTTLYAACCPTCWRWFGGGSADDQCEECQIRQSVNWMALSPEEFEALQIEWRRAR